MRAAPRHPLYGMAAAAKSPPWTPKHSLRSRRARLGDLRGEGFIGLVGPFWMKKDGDELPLRLLAEAKHHNRRGVVQGGMIMTFADRSMGMTAWYANDKKPQATVHLDVHFIDAVQIGEFVEANCRVVRRTRSLIFMSGELTVGERVVATANGVWKALGKS
jgi:acyl-coenzyme A thioesterase PaaI-like protein